MVAAQFNMASVASHQFKASSITGLADGDAVSTWNNLIGASNATGSGAARPTYRTNSGDPYVEFDGTNDFMSAAVGGQSAFAMACVFERVSTTSYGRVIGWNGGGVLPIDLANNLNIFINFAAMSNSATISSPPTGFILGYFERSGSSGRIRINGTETTGTVGANTLASTLYFGSNDAGTENGNVRFKEIVICNSALGTTPFNALAGYFASTYGLTL